MAGYVAQNRRGNTARALGWAPSDMRIANQWMLYTALFDTPLATVPEFAGLLGVTKPTVSAGLTGLEDVGLVRRTGTRTGASGRAPAVFEADPRVGWIVAVEIGRQRLRVALADLAGTIVEQFDVPTVTAEHVPSVRQLADEIDEMLRRQRVSAESGLLSFVVASPGVYVASQNTFLHNVTLPALSTGAFIEELRNRFPVPISVENDANMAAVGEIEASPDGDTSTFLYVHVGIGVGLGVVVGGELHRGAHGAAGEPLFMHFHSAPNFPSGDGVAREEDDLVAFARIQGDRTVASASEILGRARDGDLAAQDVLHQEIEYLSELLVPAIAILDPDRIVFGGVVGEQIDAVLPALGKRLKRSIPLKSPNLATTTLGSSATVRGGIAYYLASARQAAFDRALGL